MTSSACSRTQLYVFIAAFVWLLASLTHTFLSFLLCTYTHFLLYRSTYILYIMYIGDVGVYRRMNCVPTYISNCMRNFKSICSLCVSRRLPMWIRHSFWWPQSSQRSAALQQLQQQQQPAAAAAAQMQQQQQEERHLLRCLLLLLPPSSPAHAISAAAAGAGASPPPNLEGPWSSRKP